jgi:hypothetical protein
VKLDKTAPTASLAVSAGTAGANGWYTSDVTISATGTDSISEPVTCTADQFQTDETTGATFNGSCVNDAGLSADAAPLTVKLDKTAPTAALAVTAGTLGSNGWYTSDVTVSTTGADAISGATCTADQFQNDETAGAVFDGSCVNGAGLIANAAPLTVKLDKTAPTISAAITGGTLGSNGWYIDDVTVGFTCGDALAGIPAGTCPASQTLSAEGSSSSIAQTVTDAAGNTSAASNVVDVKIDKTAPTGIAFTGGGLSDGASYYFGFVPAGPTGCSATDAISGMDGCAVSGYGASVGVHTVTASATDKAGNNSSARLTYTVAGWTLKGFFQPVTSASNEWNQIKGGSTVPLKFRVFAGPTELTSTSYVVGFTATTIACPTGPYVADVIVDVSAQGGTVLRYDATGGQFIFNWATPKKAGVCYLLTMTAQDGSTLTARFMTK